MKRRDLIRHLRSHDCEFLREGGNHTVFVNRGKRKSTTIPRHRKVNDYLGTINSRTALRLIREWALAHREELQLNWDRARAGESLERIPPLD